MHSKKFNALLEAQDQAELDQAESESEVVKEIVQEVIDTKSDTKKKTKKVKFLQILCFYIKKLINYIYLYCLYNIYKMPYATSELSKTIDNLFGGNKIGQKGGSKFDLSNLSNLFKLISDKKSFFILTLANLITQLGITYYFMVKMNIDPNDSETTNKIRLLGFLQIGIILILVFVPMPIWLKFIIFSVFSAIWGYMFSPLRQVVGEDAVKMALMGTISIFALMFTFGVGLILS